MEIIVCIKQVPDTNEVRINQETGTLIRDGVPSIINPDDKNALELALEFKDKHGANVTALCMGPPQAKNALKEALAMGADHGVLISGRTFGGSDTWATATVLAAAIETIGKFDLIICGRQAIDGDTAQVGPEIAEFLDIPQITYAKNVEYKDGEFFVTRFTETGDYLISAKAPLLISAIKELNTPRYPKVKSIFKYYTDEDVDIRVISDDELTVDATQIGLKGSPTNVFKSFVPVKEKHNDMIEGSTADEKADKLMRILSDLKLL